VPQIVEPRPRELQLADVSAEVGGDRPLRERLPDRVRIDDFEQLEGAPILLDGPTLGVRGHRVTHLRTPSAVAEAALALANLLSMKRIGFLSFGHWSDSRYSQVRSASDALLQSIELAVAAEELGADGAYFRVHHFARQLASPFPLLAAVGARTARIEIGTGVVDMRYENPFYMAEAWRKANRKVGDGSVGKLAITTVKPRTTPPRLVRAWRGAITGASIDLFRRSRSDHLRRRRIGHRRQGRPGSPRIGAAATCSNTPRAGYCRLRTTTSARSP
jgi:hypothetical protein